MDVRNVSRGYRPSYLGDDEEDQINRDLAAFRKGFNNPQLNSQAKGASVGFVAFVIAAGAVLTWWGKN